MLKVHPPPAHDALHGPVWSGLDEVGQFGLWRGRGAGRVALGPAVRQPLRAVLVEAVHPVAQSLPVHAADAGGLGLVHPVQDARTAASDSKRRLWLAFLVAAASRRSSPAEK